MAEQRRVLPGSDAAGKPAEVFWAALKLGSTSFGGPVAHLGYFERVYVRQRGWLSPAEYASLVGMCQLLPGPTSSQVGLLIGLRRAGWIGALAAWVGFTLPSAVLMYAFAVVAPRAAAPLMQNVLHGLMLMAVAVVAQAVWCMARALCPDRGRATIAVIAAALILLHGSGTTQLVAMLVGAAGGWILGPRLEVASAGQPLDVGVRAPWTALVIFCGVSFLLPLLAIVVPNGPVALASTFYRAGALVFGGGHVVLPLLNQALVPSGMVSSGTFLAGYGFAQCMPGPLFTVAAYLGAASAQSHSPTLWAAVALIALFLPGLLLAIAGLPLWSALMRVARARAILGGINAAVVGILAAALYDPVWLNTVRNGADVVIAVTGLLLLQRWRTPPIVVVSLCVVANIAIARMG